MKVDFSNLAVPEKIQIGVGGGLRMYFSENPHGILDLSLCAIPEKTSFHPGDSGVDTPWKFQGQKPKPMEIPYEFSVKSPGNSILTDPWKFKQDLLESYKQLTSNKIAKAGLWLVAIA